MAPAEVPDRLPEDHCERSGRINVTTPQLENGRMAEDLVHLPLEARLVAAVRGLPWLLIRRIWSLDRQDTYGKLRRDLLVNGGESAQKAVALSPVWKMARRRADASACPGRCKCSKSTAKSSSPRSSTKSDRMSTSTCNNARQKGDPLAAAAASRAVKRYGMRRLPVGRSM
eukprot:CAMPEP_0179146254 /NCGR_PEP_ID=MMETSP0796-20121207/70611_1 /TAXON_ID=73915 /ORGANISM="Pyrodinium bahamense, Strain pbaha01" /LENGTH=170 /DNA_ID=CAMNT_0020846711 /DNA_START=283 /DNA_END=796 /DNA_ORIENTATION=-